MAPEAGEQPDANTAAVAGGEQSPQTSAPGTGTGADPDPGTGTGGDPDPGTAIEPGTGSGTGPGSGTNPDTGGGPGVGPDVAVVDPEPGPAVDAVVQPTG